MYNLKSKNGRFSKITLLDGLWYPIIPLLCLCDCREVVWSGREYKSGHNSKKNNPNKDKKALLITKEKQRRSHLGQVSPNKGNFGKPSGMKGKHHTEESKELNRLAHIGTHHTDATKEKMCESRIGIQDGEDNPNWQGGKSFEIYPKEFNENLKNQIRLRDFYICQLCGKEQKEELIEYNVSFAVHHINQNKKDCKKENLISLCNRCHGKINFNPHYAKNLLKLISRLNNMSTLSNEDIKICLNSNILKIHGMNEKTIRENGIDLTLSNIYAIENENIDKDEIIDMHNLREDRFILKESNGEIILYPNQFMLLSTKEIIEVPNNIMGFCCIRSTIARNGILCPPTILDCGFHGALTIEIYNTTKRPILLHEGDRFLHVVLDYVNTPSSIPYCGLYQGQNIVTPPKKSIL